MQQATDSGWYSTEGGAEVFVAKGTVRPDNHPDVKAVPSLFEKLPSEPTKVAAKAKRV
jgi:hypothetical protein